MLKLMLMIYLHRLCVFVVNLNVCIITFANLLEIFCDGHHSILFSEVALVYYQHGS